MTDRPPEFDAKIVQWMPFLRKMARRMESRSQDREELIQNTVMTALHRWASYKEDGSFPGWLVFQMREQCAVHRRRAARRKETSLSKTHFVGIDEVVTFDNWTVVSAPATQEQHTEARQVIDAMGDGRPGSVLLRLAMGEELREIGDDLGVSRARVQQIGARARSDLIKKLNNNVRVAA